MFGYVSRDEGSDLLIDFVVFMVTIHPPDVVDHILIDHGSEFFVFQSHLPQQKLNSAHRQQNALSPENHDASHTFFANVGVEGWTQLLHQLHDCTWDPA